MNKNIVGFWNEKKVKLKKEYSCLTDADLYYNEGKEREMMEMLGYKLGKTIEELSLIITDLK